MQRPHWWPITNTTTATTPRMTQAKTHNILFCQLHLYHGAGGIRSLLQMRAVLNAVRPELMPKPQLAKPRQARAKRIDTKVYITHLHKLKVNTTDRRPEFKFGQ